MPLPTTTNTPHPRGQGFAVAIDETLFRPAFGPDRALQIETAPLQAPAVDTRQNPEELNDDYGQTFARDDFTGGEGLDRAHTRDERANQSSRFYDSRNIDVSTPLPGETREIRLLQSTANLDALTAATIRLAYNGVSLWATNGTALRRSDNPAAAAPTFVAEDPHAGEAATIVSDVAALGTTVYAALGANGIHRKLSGGAWAHYNDLAATRVWAVKGRIMAAAGASLYVITAAGVAPSPLYTLPPDATWGDVADGGGAILAGASDGYIYAFTPNDTGALILRAQTLVEGEKVTAVGSAQGLVFYGTSEPNGTGAIGRLWRAELSDGSTLVGAQLIREWRSSTLDRAPRRIVGTRDSVYTAIIEDGTETHAWRYDLAVGGIVRSYIFTGSGATRGLTVIGGRLFAAIGGSGVHRRTDLFVASGWLIGPLGDFFTSALKSWVGARIDAAGVGSGAYVDLAYTTNPDDMSDAGSATWRKVKSLSSGVDATESTMNVTARSIAGKVTLGSTTDRAGSPAVRSFAFRAYPSGGGEVDKVITIPLNVSDQIEAPNRRVKHVKGWGNRVYDMLRSFEGQAVKLRMYRPPMELRGLVESIGAPVPGVSERGSSTVFALVRFRGREVSGEPVTGEALGVGTLGVMSMGT